MSSIERNLNEGIENANKIIAYIKDGTPKDKKSIQKTIDKALLATQLIPLFERQVLQNSNKNNLLTTFDSFVLTAKQIIWLLKNNSDFNSVENADYPNYNLLVAQEAIIERAQSAVRSALGKRPAQISAEPLRPSPAKPPRKRNPQSKKPFLQSSGIIAPATDSSIDKLYAKISTCLNTFQAVVNAEETETLPPWKFGNEIEEDFQGRRDRLRESKKSSIRTIQKIEDEICRNLSNKKIFDITVEYGKLYTKATNLQYNYKGGRNIRFFGQQFKELAIALESRLKDDPETCEFLTRIDPLQKKLEQARIRIEHTGMKKRRDTTLPPSQKDSFIPIQPSSSSSSSCSVSPPTEVSQTPETMILSTPNDESRTAVTPSPLNQSSFLTLDTKIEIRTSSRLKKAPARLVEAAKEEDLEKIEHEMAQAPIHSSSSTEEAPMEINDEPQEILQGFGRKSARIRKATEEIVSHAPVKRRKVSSKKESPPIPVLSQKAMDDRRPLKEVIESMTVEARGGVNKEYRISPDFDRFQAKFFRTEKITWSEYFRGVLEKDVDQRLKMKFENFKKSREKGDSSDFRIEMQPVLGHVLFTTKKIKKGTIIDEYSGQIIKCDHSHKKNVYLFEFDTQHTIITEYGTDGEVVCNKSSFIAHNAEKYCNVKPVIYYDEEGPHILFEAIRDIEPGEAITFNYGQKYWTHLDIKPLTWDPKKL